ncbi:MAG TPA: hypothetical protein DEO64_09305 [Alcaligenes faecalis]|nr:hypothetical protein [Alcaligenes faecalis]
MATKAQQHRFINTADEHQQEIIRLLHEVARSRGLARVWADWVEIGAIAIANGVDKTQFKQREERYFNIVSQYQKEEVHSLVNAFAHLVQCWDKRVATGEFGDVLGGTYMMLDMGNASTGQFFTPYEISRMMASIIMGAPETLNTELQKKGFLSLQEPACGAGGMIITAVHSLADAEINYQQVIHVTAIDVDRRCVHMTFLQLALLHVPAIVIQGNALTLKTTEFWYTPAHIWGGWSRRLRQPQSTSDLAQLLVSKSDVKQKAPSNDVPEQHLMSALHKGVQTGQISLF